MSACDCCGRYTTEPRRVALEVNGRIEFVADLCTPCAAEVEMSVRRVTREREAS